jgi:MFS family permease
MMFLPHRRMYLAAFLLDFSVAVGLTAIPFFIFERLGGGPTMSGVIGALQMGIYALGCLCSATLVTRSKNGMFLALVGVTTFILPYSLLPWVTSPLLCAVATSLPFIGLALAWPAMQSWLGAEPDPVQRALHLTGFNTATAFGFTVSPLITGPLYDLDYRLPFVLLFFTGMITVWLLWSLPLEEPRDTTEDGGEDDKVASTEPIISRGLLYASWGAILTANGLFAALRSVYPSRVDTLVADGTLKLWGDYSPTWLASVGPATAFSWLAFILPLATVVTFAVLGRTNKWQGRFRWIVAGQLAAAIATALLGHAQSIAAMLVCFVVVGANYGLCFFTSLYYSLADARHKHRRAAVNEGLLGAGGFIGGIGAGYAAGAVGLPLAFQWSPALVVVAITAQLLLLASFRK